MRNTKRQRGQGMTEYIIIIALIAIATIAVVTAFGDNIRALFGASANAMVGQNSSPAQLGGKTVQNQQHTTLQNFAEKRQP
jgi:Flp pilus assembly pilin Flp